MAEVQDIFRDHIATYRQNHILSPDQAKVVNAILSCRTSALGAHVDTCNECGYQKISYNSCRNRHCPKCQTFVKEQWVEKQNQYLLNTNYFHVVFTMPDELNTIVLRNQKAAYSLFFKAVSETLLELCADKKHLGATPGITAVLHTWGQNLTFHPHMHCIVTGGGLTKDRAWRASRKKFFIPVKVLSRKFRGKFLSYLKRAGLSFGAALYQKEWIVYCKPPFGNTQNVINYLRRYTHRVAISNHRIIKSEDGLVAFRWKDYSDGNKQKVMQIAAVEFIRRFLIHTLPKGFRKIRHYGILASRDKSARISLCKRLTRTAFSAAKVPLTTIERLRNMFGADFDLCPRCGNGHLARASPSKETAFRKVSSLGRGEMCLLSDILS